METKICSKCKSEKSVNEFAKRYDPKRPVTARYPACKQCVYQRRKENGIELRRGRKTYRVRKLRKYGLTIESYQLLLEEQGGVCAICDQKVEENLDVDHDHKTNQVRGLLCRRCNLGLGFFQDNSKWLIKAASYVDNIDY